MKIVKTQHSGKAKATGFPEETTEEMARLNISIQKSFYKKIKQRALDEDKTVRDIVLEALEVYMRRSR